MRPPFLRLLLLASSALAVQAAVQCARGQATLPEITVTPPKEATKTKPAPKQQSKAVKPAVVPVPAPAPTGPPPENPIVTQTKAFNAARENILPKIGVNVYELSHQDIEALPQGTNAALDKVLLQAPGVTLDSAASGNLHVRNEHANLQYRINGIIIPDGVSGFGQLLETSFVGSMSLVTGALPAQYGLRNTGLVDIQTRTGAQDPGGTISIYGGNRSTFTPSIEYGGTSGRTEYFFTGRGFFTDLGLENTTSAINAIHDWTQQGRAFGYLSTLLDDTTRLTTISGISIQKYQIPNNPGQPPQFTAFGVSDFDSAALDQRQLERNFYNVIALQKKLDGADLQVAYFSRYSTLHFMPDPLGDLIFNGVSSDVYRSSFLSGVQGDAAFRLNPAHTLRTGFYSSAESTNTTTKDTLLPVNSVTGAPIDTPFDVVDANSKMGYLLGVYVQDEWKLTNKLTLNLGIRFDQMYQFVDANQFSPRASLVYKPVDGTTLHFGYARYFTPPSQVIAGPTNLALFDNTTEAPASCPPPHPVSCNGPVLPERSHYFDVGVTQKVLPGLEIGVDAYYKIARDLLDDGQFGQAYVLTGFNYDQGFNKGVELTAKYKYGNLTTYANLAWAQQMATKVVSNQFLFDPDELAYIASHFVYTDHAQTWTGSAGVSYLWNGTRFSTDLIYGSGLRNDFANTGHLPLYTQVNAGISHEFKWDDFKPTTVRFDVINVFDTTHEIRDGSGIGVFAPQYGPRRAYYVGLSQKF
jgi:outer membrane receptor protein involved in Fe transport